MNSGAGAPRIYHERVLNDRLRLVTGLHALGCSHGWVSCGLTTWACKSCSCGRRISILVSTKVSIVHTITVCICSTGGKIIKQEDDEEENTPSLQVSRTLTLSHPGGFKSLQDACGAIACACCTVSRGLLVRIVCYVSSRQRDRSSSHEGLGGRQSQVLTRHKSSAGKLCIVASGLKEEEKLSSEGFRREKGGMRPRSWKFQYLDTRAPLGVISCGGTPMRPS